MNLTSKPCPEFFAKVIGFPDTDETSDRVSITDLLRANVPTVIDFYNSGWGGCRPVAQQIKRWSTSYPEVLFVTVCVDSRPMPVAREFQNLYFGTGSSVVNAFIEERNDYPKFPTQLGWQVLLLLDCEGRIATTRSPTFLDFREKAFEGVEHLLEPLIAAGKAQQVATSFVTSSSENLVSL